MIVLSKDSQITSSQLEYLSPPGGFPKIFLLTARFMYSSLVKTVFPLFHNFIKLLYISSCFGSSNISSILFMTFLRWFFNSLEHFWYSLYPLSEVIKDDAYGLSDVARKLVFNSLITRVLFLKYSLIACSVVIRILLFLKRECKKIFTFPASLEL